MNIEELARQAGICQSLNGKFFQWEKADIERFAALVLEEAAKEADKRRHAGDAGPALIADAIRAMKGTP